jgi:glycosyltransferase involved in cell wall biosynthesis
MRNETWNHQGEARVKVAFFHSTFRNPGGAELLASTQASYLHGEGWEVSLATFRYQERIWGEKLSGIPVELLPRRHWMDLIPFGGRLSKWKRRARRAEPFLQSASLVLAHNSASVAMLGHMQTPGLKAWYCHEAPWRLHPEATNYDLVQHLPSYESSMPALHYRSLAEFRAGILGRATRDHALADWDRAGVEHLERIFANSEFCRDNLQRIYGRDDVRVLPPIIAFADHTHRPGLDREAPQILTLARLEVLKNVDTVLRGFAHFASELPGARLHVVGDGRERLALERLARDLGVARQVVFHGYLDPKLDHDRLEAIFQACDVFALLPIDESFGLVFPEAAARGLLLVGPDRGGPSEVLEGGRLGWTVPFHSPEALSEVFQRIWTLSDEEAGRRRREMDEACRARFSIANAGPALRDALRA